jgi:hypothetical protein
VVARNRAGVDRGRQVVRRDRHAKIDARAAFDRAVHRSKIGQIALHDFGAELAQGLGAIILPAHQGAHLVSFGEQRLGEVAADRTDRASCSGHEDFVVISITSRRSHALPLLPVSTSETESRLRPLLNAGLIRELRAIPRARNG